MKDEEDRRAFKEYLEKVRQLGKRSIAVYMCYYDCFDPLSLSQEYVNEYIIKHKNNFAVRGFIKNYLEFHGIESLFSFPKRAKGNHIKRLIRPVTPEDMEKIKRYLYKKSFKFGLIFEILYQGGLRRVEIPTIKLGSFNWEEWLKDQKQHCKLIVLGKGNKERVVLINPDVAYKICMRFIKTNSLKSKLDLLNFFKQHSNNLLFARQNGDMLTEKIVYDIIKKGSSRAIGRDVRPHELRHLRATELEKKDVNIRDIKNYLGHSRTTTTEIYLHKSGEESIKTIAEKLKASD